MPVLSSVFITVKTPHHVINRGHFTVSLSSNLHPEPLCASLYIILESTTPKKLCFPTFHQQPFHTMLNTTLATVSVLAAV